MDVKIPPPPTFTPDLPLRRPEPPAFPSLLAGEVKKLEERIRDLERTTVAIKALEETILAEKVVSLLRVGPTDTVLFTVPENVDVDDIPSSVHKSLKEKLKVAHVFFVTHGIDVSVISSTAENEKPTGWHCDGCRKPMPPDSSTHGAFHTQSPTCGRIVPDKE